MIDHGKDFLTGRLSLALTKRGIDHNCLAYANPLKALACAALKLSPEELEEAKKNRTEVLVDYQCTTDVRKFIQDLGTQMKVIFGDKIFTHHLCNLALTSPSPVLLVSDFRYPVECWGLQELEDLEVYTINIFNSMIRGTDEHSSENSLQDFGFDFYVNNTGLPGASASHIDQSVSDILNRIL